MLPQLIMLVVRQTKRRLVFVGPFLYFVSLGKQRNEEKKLVFSSHKQKINN
jgi:hypothetical protein